MKGTKKLPFKNQKRAKVLGMAFDHRQREELPKHGRAGKTQPRQMFRGVRAK
jgi:hypothetical protein